METALRFGGDPGQQAQTPRDRLRALAQRARAVLWFERIWPPVAFAGAAVALFFAAAWFGLWLDLPSAARIAASAFVVCGVLFALSPLARMAAPRDEDALRRLDRDSGGGHRPATSSVDKLADSSADDVTRALWALHQKRLSAQIERLAVARPAPRLADRDRAALRYGALILAVAAGFVAGPEKYSRIAAAFDWRGAAAAAPSFRLDAWIDPPAYTGKPPILLDALALAKPDAAPIVTPAGSVLVGRSAGDPSIVMAVKGALTPAPDAAPAPSAPPAQAPATQAGDVPPVSTTKEQRWIIKGDGSFTVTRGGSPLASFTISALPAHPPTIALTAPAKSNARGSITLSYKLGDDYGVAQADATFVRPPVEGKAGRSLAPPPTIDLQLPGGSGVGEAQTTRDLSDHPWAGAKVLMTLHARNLAGQDGRGEPVAITLPQRHFDNPLARALVEQRRDLVLDPDANRPRVMTALDALLLAPEAFGTKDGVFLGLTFARGALAEAQSDQDLVGVADFLWAMALQIEEGDATQAERDLRAAEQKLREALQRGASDEEIRKLMDELRAAADKFTRELAARAKEAPQDEQQRQMSSEDLKSLLDRMEDTARTGDKAQAEAMLDQLQNMFENMKSAQKSGESPGQRAMRKQMSELDKLLRDQQALRDDTFRQQQRDSRRRASPNPDQPDDQDASPSDPSDPSQGELEDRQQQLRERLQAMRRALKELGMEQEKGFGDAEDAMGDAKEALKPGGQGTGKAIGAQGRALEALRQGAEGMAKQMQGQGQGEGDGSETVERGEGGQNGRDPLGRPLGREWRGPSQGRLNEGVGAAQRARRVLEEVERRLGDPSRRVEERDYLERLLQRY